MLLSSTYNVSSTSGVLLTPNVTYGKGLVNCANGVLDDPGRTCHAIDLLLDVYAPATASASLRPAMVLAHGGGNSGGDKNFVYLDGSARYFAARGFVVFNIDYRLSSDEGPVPSDEAASGLGWEPFWKSAYPAVRDFKAAVRFVRANAAKYGVDPRKIVGSGGSAGATNALAAGVTFEADYKDELNATQDPTLPTTHLEESSALQVVYAHWSSDGEITLAQEHDPANRSRYATSNPPVIEMHGDQDTTIPIAHARAVQAAYAANGVPYELHVLSGCGHAAWGYGCAANGCTGGGYCPHMDELAFPFVAKHLSLLSRPAVVEEEEEEPPYGASAAAAPAAPASEGEEEARFLAEYYLWRNSSATRWVDSVPLPAGQEAAGAIDWVARGAVTRPTSQGRCATCQAFSCVADVEGAWRTAGHKLLKLSEQEMIDCAGGDAYGMHWIQSNGGIASASTAPLANHSDPNITGCRYVTDCAAVEQRSAAYINGSTCLTNHDEDNILAVLQHGPMSVSINAGPLNGYHGGVINCTGSGIDHAVALVAYGTDAVTGEAYWTIKNSWGPDFGESSPPGRTGEGERGYARLKFGNTCLRGPCQAFVGKPAWERAALVEGKAS